jgi:hypothetical protein
LIPPPLCKLKKKKWIVNWKGFGRKRSWSNRDSIPAFASKDWGKPQLMCRSRLRTPHECKSRTLSVCKPAIEQWFTLFLAEERRSRLFESRVVRKMCGRKTGDGSSTQTNQIPPRGGTFYKPLFYFWYFLIQIDFSWYFILVVAINWQESKCYATSK